MPSRLHRYRAVALPLILLAAPLAAQDQTLEPNATVSETNSDCTTANAHTRLSDNSDATLCDGGDGSSSESYTILLDFPTPTSNPSTTTNAQAFQCRMQKSSATGSGDPTFELELWCNGSVVEAGGTHTATSTSPVEFTETFTFSSGSCAASGSDAQLQIDVHHVGGAPAGRRSADSIDCDWDVTWASAGGRRIWLAE